MSSLTVLFINILVITCAVWQTQWLNQYLVRSPKQAAQCPKNLKEEFLQSQDTDSCSPLASDYFSRQNGKQIKIETFCLYQYVMTRKYQKKVNFPPQIKKYESLCNLH